MADKIDPDTPSRRSGPRSMRMAELSARSGVPRETIHFYLREGLLPRPAKGGRTVAFYGPEHLDRLRTIRHLREEKYLPLAVIRRLLDSPAAAAERDLDALADVLHIAPDPSADRGGPPPSPAAAAEADARGLLGPPREIPPDGAGADERRVLAIVDEVLALDPAARALTLDDLEASAEGLTALVEREAALFFDAVIRSADAASAIAALRRGRGAVARFITAYRDLMLRRVVEDLLVSIERGPDRIARAATVPLSPDAERRLGVAARRAMLWSQGEAARVWHLFSCGAAQELARLPADMIAAAGPRAAALAAWGAHEIERRPSSLRALDEAAAAAPGFAL
ncbi:MAG: MerR family transcriptional regulator, partial [Polyangiaceae bacterium]|nr:MerR family transcriptional regulator [Polyangiaceae bacterium]